jgi:signal transduction histidine kinase/ActR/RegA family two-component response regulator
MTSSSSLRARLVGVVFIAITPAWVLMYLTHLPWIGFLVGLLALGAAWFGGERFILRQVRILGVAAQQLAMGDLTVRTGLDRETGELADLGRSIDRMAASLDEKIKEREQAERTLLNRSFQQTVVSALGQFALVTPDIPALLNQVVMLVSQTLEVEYCKVLELDSHEQRLTLRAGFGWKTGFVGKASIRADANTQSGFTLSAGEPVVVEDFECETRFGGSDLLKGHGVVSGITVLISGHGRTFGVLGAHSTRRRKFTEDEVHFMMAVATVLAMAVERGRAEVQLQKLAAFAQLNPNPAMELTQEGKISYFNDAALELAFATGQSHPRCILPPTVKEIVEECLRTQSALVRMETKVSERTLSWSFHPVQGSPVVHCYVEDITDRLNLQAQLWQSQKMESVGQLAAGVAHDFNNMLTIIQGHSGLLLSKPDLPQPVMDSAQAIYFGAERAAGLTRQLLMFSRKNVMQQKPLDLREVVMNTSKMLMRLLGETITLEFIPPPEIPLISADVGMIEQVIMNLAVNARDAMPRGGTLSIATTMRQIDEADAQRQPQARRGNYVCLQVSDTGCGMDEATRNRMFEPFFTTKEVGKGTGLGLATVWGIIKQHEGWIECESEVGRGTTFSVYLPAVGEPVEQLPERAAPNTSFFGGKETVLIVEDEPILRQMAHLMLTDCGYQILEASSGVEALKVWERHHGEIDLVLTDMVMPDGVSGMDLAHRLIATNPDVKIVFASGYSMDDLDTTFLREGHAHFLQKPYTHSTLTRAVREALDKRPVEAVLV